MTPPPTIPFSSIILGERGRTTYTGIEQLAQLIQDNGLIQPIVLVPLTWAGYPENPVVTQYGLDAGGRRYHALAHLGVETLYHATTSDPTRPGYILKGEEFATPMQRILTEIAENLGRVDLDWRDECALIVKAWRMAQRDAHLNLERILMADFGAMLNVDYQNLLAAEAIYDDLVINPERYKEVTSIRAAFTKVFKVNEVELTKILAAKSIATEGPKLSGAPAPSFPVQVQNEPVLEGEAPPTTIIPLTSAFVNCNSLEYMTSLPGPTFDHIITDPDYGVSVERLSANMSSAGSGVVQANITDSLGDLKVFIAQSFRVIRDQGFLIFWYDLDHHEKLQQFATSVGFKVQRWPLIWHKTDYFSNADPGHNFTKNIEYAMVCRKQNAMLSQVQKSCVYACASGTTTREFNHPFSKPIEVWKWIYGAVTIKGQIVFDPFAGAGTACVAASSYGLKSVGCELDPGHYSNLLLNMQREIKSRIGHSVLFT